MHYSTHSFFLEREEERKKEKEENVMCHRKDIYEFRGGRGLLEHMFMLHLYLRRGYDLQWRLDGRRADSE